jgi:hypothetical protein
MLQGKKKAESNDLIAYEVQANLPIKPLSRAL